MINIRSDGPPPPTFLIVYSQPREDGLDSLVNQNAPNFIAETLNGKIFDLSEHKGKIVMVNFWSLSCAAEHSLACGIKESDF